MEVLGHIPALSSHPSPAEHVPFADEETGSGRPPAGPGPRAEGQLPTAPQPAHWPCPSSGLALPWLWYWGDFAAQRRTPRQGELRYGRCCPSRSQIPVAGCRCFLEAQGMDGPQTPAPAASPNWS